MNLLLVLILFVGAPALNWFEISAPEDHPLCPTLGCARMECIQLSFRPENPGQVALPQGECVFDRVENGRVYFIVNPTTSIVGFCLYVVFCDGSVSECAT